MNESGTRRATGSFRFCLVAMLAAVAMVVGASSASAAPLGPVDVKSCGLDINGKNPCPKPKDDKPGFELCDLELGPNGLQCVDDGPIGPKDLADCGLDINGQDPCPGPKADPNPEPDPNPDPLPDPKPDPEPECADCTDQDSANPLATGAEDSARFVSAGEANSPAQVNPVNPAESSEGRLGWVGWILAAVLSVVSLVLFAWRRQRGEPAETSQS